MFELEVKNQKDRLYLFNVGAYLIVLGTVQSKVFKRLWYYYW